MHSLISFCPILLRLQSHPLPITSRLCCKRLHVFSCSTAHSIQTHALVIARNPPTGGRQGTDEVSAHIKWIYQQLQSPGSNIQYQSFLSRCKVVTKLCGVGDPDASPATLSRKFLGDYQLVPFTFSFITLPNRTERSTLPSMIFPLFKTADQASQPPSISVSRVGSSVDLDRDINGPTVAHSSPLV